MFSVQEQEERNFYHDSLHDHCVVQAQIDGALRPDRAWVLSDIDVWVRNPHWNGQGSDRHPEDDVVEFDVDVSAEAPEGPRDDDFIPF